MRKKNNDHQVTNGTDATPSIVFSEANRSSTISAEGLHSTVAAHTLDTHTVDSTSAQQDTQPSENKNANYVQKMDSTALNVNDTEPQTQAADNYNPTTPNGESKESDVDPVPA